MSIQEFELGAYSREIEALKNESFTIDNENDNYTFHALHISNRVHLTIVGLCSLVEATLFELAKRAEKDQKFKLCDISGSGITKLKTYLSKSGFIDFGKISKWSEFKHIYELRNTIVHSYGGMVESKQIEKAKISLQELGLCESALVVGGVRIRLNIDTLELFFEIIKELIHEIQENI